MTEKLKLAVRIALHEDLDVIEGIEEHAFFETRVREDFAELSHCTHRKLLVVTYNTRAVAFASIEILADKVHVHRFAVDRRFRRRGVGTQLLDALAAGLKKGWAPRESITCDVHEENLGAQKFMRSIGWRAFGIYTDDRGQTFYRFRWLTPEADALAI